jgi:hypothetical protein
VTGRHFGAFGGVCLLTIGVGLSGVAEAQAPQRPSGGLFGSKGEPSTGQNLDVNLGLTQAYDDNLFADAGTVDPSAPIVSGQYTLLEAGANYTWLTDRVEFGATGASAFRYYDQAAGVWQSSHSAGVGVTARFRRRTTLFVNQSASYSPSYLFGLFPTSSGEAPGDSTPIAPDYAVNDYSSYGYATNATVSHGFTRRGSISVGGDYRFTDLVFSSDEQRDVVAYGAMLQYSRNVGRHSSWSSSYQYRVGEFGLPGAGAAVENSVRVGFSHIKVLSPTRRATLGAGVGYSSTDPGTDPSLGPERGQFSSVLADFSLGYEFTRDWNVRADYRRGIEFVAELTEPVFSDAVSTSVSGLVSGRVQLGFAAGYSSGQSARYSTSTFDTYTATAQVQYGLTQRLALKAAYLYYFYDFRDIQLAPGQPSRLERNGVSVGLTTWIPAFRSVNRAAR